MKFAKNFRNENASGKANVNVTNRKTNYAWQTDTNSEKDKSSIFLDNDQVRKFKMVFLSGDGTWNLLKCMSNPKRLFVSKTAR